VNDEDIAVFISTDHNAHVLVIRIKGEISDLRFIPGYICAVGVMYNASSTMPDNDPR